MPKRFILDFYFNDDGRGRLETDDKRQAEVWFSTFSQPFHDKGKAEQVVKIRLFDNHVMVKEYHHTVEV
jgi:hypothetical protein